MSNTTENRHDLRYTSEPTLTGTDIMRPAEAEDARVGVDVALEVDVLALSDVARVERLS